MSRNILHEMFMGTGKAETLPLPYLFARLKLVNSLEREYNALMRDCPWGVESRRKWEITTMLAQVLPLELEIPPVKRIEPYTAYPETRIITYPSKLTWLRNMTYHSYEMAGLWKPLSGSPEFCSVIWSADRKTQLTPREARDIREPFLHGKKSHPVKRRGRPVKSVAKHNKAIKEHKLAEHGVKAKQAKRKSRRAPLAV